MKSGLGTILALLLTTPAFAQAPSPPSDQPFVIASGALVAAAMTDLTIGTYLIGAGRGREAGLGAGLEQRPVLFGVVKGSVMATEIALLRAVHRRHPRVARNCYLPAMTTVSGVGSGCEDARPKPAAVSIS